MESAQATTFSFVYVVWGLITAVLIALLSYRATLFFDEYPSAGSIAPRDHEKELKLVAVRSRLLGEIIVLSVMSSALLLTCLGLSIFTNTF